MLGQLCIVCGAAVRMMRRTNTCSPDCTARRDRSRADTFRVPAMHPDAASRGSMTKRHYPLGFAGLNE